MSFFEDLSEYTFLSHVEEKLVNVGWLCEQEPYRKGKVDQQLIEKLYAIAEEVPPINLTRGFHSCEFCTSHSEWQIGLPVERPSGLFYLGSAEIRVPGMRRNYAAPNLVCHYVSHHDYCPPDEFLEALRLYDFESEPYQPPLSDFDIEIEERIAQLLKARECFSLSQREARPRRGAWPWRWLR